MDAEYPERLMELDMGPSGERTPDMEEREEDRDSVEGEGWLTEVRRVSRVDMVVAVVFEMGVDDNDEEELEEEGVGSMFVSRGTMSMSKGR